jgi:hypothetical protein
MKSSRDGNGFDTTLGELMATISDVAFENSDDTKEAYDLARLVLVEILTGKSLGRETVDQPPFWN